jgi:hypothetical protein
MFSWQPGYVATPEMMVECARVMLSEPQNVPVGVHTTATAFRNTNLIAGLQV